MAAKNTLAKDSSPEPDNRFAKARMLVKSFGHILSIYSSAIRAIAAAPSVLKTEDPKLIDAFAHSSMQSPLSISPTLSYSFRQACQELYARQYENLNAAGQPKIKELIKLTTASELSSIIGLTYFFKLIAKSVDPEELAAISPLVSTYIKHGATIGTQLGSLFGRGGGIGAAGLRMLGLIALIKADPKAFNTLRKRIDKTGELNHLEFERESFGFCHLDVASVIAGELGFGTIAREAFIGYQIPQAQPSNPQAVFWRHTLIEASRLWQEKSGSKKGSAIGSLDDVDGYKWLWSHNASQDILPGLNESDLEMLNNTVRQDPSINSKGQLKILVVEDDSTSASMLAKIVDPFGHVSICGSGEAAADLVKNNQQFDLVFIDVGLQGMSGLEFLNIFRDSEVNQGISEELSALVFILTSDENPQTVMQSFSHGANGYLTKPLNRQLIFEELQKFGLELAGE